MKRLLLGFLFIFCYLFVSPVGAQIPAFPGAEGHGRFTTGGRGGKVVHVTNLNDSGTGSFRQAVSGSDKKIVVFDVGGVIALKSNVNIGANTTIEGQTAPAPGITLRYYTVNPNGNNIIMRFIRIRRGQEKDVNDGADASTARHFTGMMLDHCSFSWSIDEVASFYDNNNFTMQWCTIGESLNNAGHNKGAHGYGGIWGGKLASFHHNLICHVNNRSPRFNGARYDWTGYTANQLYSQYRWENAVQAENVDFRNCVVYNCGNGCYGGPGGGKVNMVGNYYKSGPAASTTNLTTVTVGANGNSEGYPKYWDMTSRYFLSDNLIDGKAAGWSQMTYDNGTYTLNGEHYSEDPNHYNGSETQYYTFGGTDYVKIKLDEPGPAGEVTTHSPAVAFANVLGYAGASLHRDDVDQRYADEAQNGTATYKGSVTGRSGRIDKVSDVNGYTEENFGTGSRLANFDTDKDGMPDAWETANGLNPNDASDAKLFTLDDAKYYTNLEVYCNSLVQQIMLSGNAQADDELAVKDYYPAYRTEEGTLVEAVNPDVVEREDPNPGGDEEVLTTGTLTWKLDATDALQGEVSSSLLPYITASDITVGSNLTIDKARRGLMVDFKAVAKENAVGLTNALTFSATTTSGYKFKPTKVAFFTERAGTDSGVIDAFWLGETTTSVTSSLAPARNDYTQFAQELEDVQPHEGLSSLVINIYTLNAGKAIAVGNVEVTGSIVSSSAGIHTMQAGKSGFTVAYYNLQGQRIMTPKGICIEAVSTPDGTMCTRTIFIK